jgi:hypothetical protein
MRRLLPAALAAAAALVLASCGSSDEGSTPAACLVPARAYLDALDSAPDAVRLDDSTPISDCFPAEQDAADLAQIGRAVIDSATRLNSAARRDPGGKPTLELGYLAGAVANGTSETGSIHADLVRRLDAAARFAPAGVEVPASFDRAYDDGYTAAQQNG